jgi:hypothetical protein
VAARPTFADLVRGAWAKRKGLAATAPGGRVDLGDIGVATPVAVDEKTDVPR